MVTVACSICDSALSCRLTIFGCALGALLGLAVAGCKVKLSLTSTQLTQVFCTIQVNDMVSEVLCQEFKEH